MILKAAVTDVSVMDHTVKFISFLPSAMLSAYLGFADVAKPI